MRAAGGSKRAAGAVEASLKQAAAASEKSPFGDTRAHAEAKRPRVVERAPSLKTASSVTAVALAASAANAGATGRPRWEPTHATVTISDLGGAYKPMERTYRGRSAPRLPVLEATRLGGPQRAEAADRPERRLNGADEPGVQLISHVSKRCELCSGEYVHTQDGAGWRRHEASQEHQQRASDPRTFVSLDKLAEQVNSGRAFLPQRGAASAAANGSGRAAADSASGRRCAADSLSTALAVRLPRAELKSEEAERARLECALARTEQAGIAPAGAGAEQACAAVAGAESEVIGLRRLLAEARAAASTSAAEAEARGGAELSPARAQPSQAEPELDELREALCQERAAAEAARHDLFGVRAQLDALCRASALDRARAAGKCAHVCDLLAAERRRVDSMHDQQNELEQENSKLRRGSVQQMEENERLTAELGFALQLMRQAQEAVALSPAAGAGGIAPLPADRPSAGFHAGSDDGSESGAGSDAVFDAESSHQSDGSDDVWDGSDSPSSDGPAAAFTSGHLL